MLRNYDLFGTGLPGVFSRIMVFIMTFQGAGPLEPSVIFKPQYSIYIWKDDGLVKVDEMGIFIYAVGIMTGSTWGTFINNELPVQRETLVGQD